MVKPFDYIAEANVTASNTYHGGNVPADLFKDAVRDCIRTLQLLDVIKKSLFYGRELPDHLKLYGKNRDFNDSHRFPKMLDSDEAKGVLILHSIIGQATETCEQLELLYATCVDGHPFDAINLNEEIGDAFWYAAIGLGAIGESFDSVQRRNIAKLRHRFPNKFTEFDANNRDLLGERSILESEELPRSVTGLSPNITREQIGS